MHLPIVAETCMWILLQPGVFNIFSRNKINLMLLNLDMFKLKLSMCVTTGQKCIWTFLLTIKGTFFTPLYQYICCHWKVLWKIFFSSLIIIQHTFCHLYIKGRVIKILDFKMGRGVIILPSDMGRAIKNFLLKTHWNPLPPSN
jgi:hypothetical protein